MNKAHEVMKHFVPELHIRFINISTGEVVIFSFEVLVSLTKGTIDLLFFTDDYVYDIGTGIFDIAGNEIFTRDIVKITERATKLYRTNEQYALISNDPRSVVALYVRTVPLEHLPTSLIYGSMIYGANEDLEIVGNIHLNSDMLNDNTILPIGEIVPTMMEYMYTSYTKYIELDQTAEKSCGKECITDKSDTNINNE